MEHIITVGEELRKSFHENGFALRKALAGIIPIWKANRYMASRCTLRSQALAVTHFVTAFNAVVRNMALKWT